tara:strand:+ start:208 stop:411 length:204 start_codon:yes stop_codon:yes gene_type:complete
MGCGTGSLDSVGAFQVHWEEVIGMNSVENQILLQYLEAIRREQKKTSDMIAGVGTILIIIGLIIIWR